MKRLRRWLFNLLTAVSLLICISAIIIYFFSLHTDMGVYSATAGSRYYELRIWRGNLSVNTCSQWPVNQRVTFWRGTFPDWTGVQGMKTTTYRYWYSNRLGIDVFRGWVPFFVPKKGFSFSYMLPTPTLWDISFPLWLVIATTGVLPTLWLFVFLCRRWRRHARQTHNLCPQCGYDLRATPERCPECGTSVLAKAL